MSVVFVQSFLFDVNEISYTFYVKIHILQFMMTSNGLITSIWSMETDCGYYLRTLYCLNNIKIGFN